jgi:NADH dehydrogenase
MRRRILFAFEAAEREPDAARRRAWLSFVVVGAGPTGVELAGAVREIAARTMARDFRRFDPKTTRVVLVEGAERVLAAFPEGLSRRARALLERRGIEVRTGVLVTGVDEDGVSLGAERLEARTVLWAAGVRAVPLTATLSAPLTRDGRVLVEPELSVPGRPEIQVIGDLAALREASGEWVPGMAPAAIQEGRHAAANVQRALRGEPALPFRYRDKGTLATIGRSAAVARIGRFETGASSRGCCGSPSTSPG